MFGISDGRKRLWNKLRKKPYRDAYVGEHVRRWIAHQIRAMRDARGWNQGELSRKMGKPQSVVSRLEDPSYGKMTVNTLLEVATAFDVALLVRFVDYATFIRETTDLSTAAMRVDSFAPLVAGAAGGALRLETTTANVTLARVREISAGKSPAYRVVGPANAVNATERTTHALQ